MSRSYLKALAPAAVVIGALVAASPAMATDTSFATYTGLNGTYKASTVGSLLKLTETGTVVFSFLNTSLVPTFTGISANVSFTGTAPSSAFVKAGGFDIQSLISGTYTFTTKSAYTVNGIFHPVGSDLLTAVFTGGTLAGADKGKTASQGADNSIAGETVTYSSDFLSFINTNQSDFQVALSAINPKLTGTTKLGTPFVATPVGVFSADPVPSVIGETPEPATWAMMLVGFGAIGLGIRGNARRTLRAA